MFFWVHAIGSRLLWRGCAIHCFTVGIPCTTQKTRPSRQWSCPSSSARCSCFSWWWPGCDHHTGPSRTSQPIQLLQGLCLLLLQAVGGDPMAVEVATHLQVPPLLLHHSPVLRRIPHQKCPTMPSRPPAASGTTEEAAPPHLTSKVPVPRVDHSQVGEAEAAVIRDVRLPKSIPPNRYMVNPSPGVMSQPVSSIIPLWWKNHTIWASSTQLLSLAFARSLACAAWSRGSLAVIILHIDHIRSAPNSTALRYTTQLKSSLCSCRSWIRRQSQAEVLPSHTTPVLREGWTTTFSTARYKDHTGCSRHRTSGMAQPTSGEVLRVGVILAFVFSLFPMTLLLVLPLFPIAFVILALRWTFSSSATTDKVQRSFLVIFCCKRYSTKLISWVMLQT